MRKYIKLLIVLLLTIFISFNTVNASTNTKERTEDNYLISDKITVTESNKYNILQTPAVDASEKVYDFADLFTDSEEQSLYEEITKYIDKYKMDLAVVTISSNVKSSAQEYADDFYDYNDFGINSSKDGVLFLIDMDTRNIHMTTTGQAIKMYDDKRVDEALDLVYQHMTDQEYYLGTTKFINKISSDMDSGVPSSNKNMVIDKDGNVHMIKRVNYLFITVLSFVVATVVIAILIAKNKLVRKATTAEEYLVKDSVKINNDGTTLISSNTVKHKIEHDSGGGSSSSGGSSFHSGSSGSSHGGGSHGF